MSSEQATQDEDVIDAEFERNDAPGPRALIPTYDVPMVRSDYYVRKPIADERSLVDVEKRLIAEARMAGEDFYYAWGKGDDRVEGGSVILAMALARCWGNCVVEQIPLQETRDAYIFTARFIDLETGFTYDRQFRQSKKWQVYGKYDKARKEDIRFQIGQSKAARNAILRSLPEWLKNKAIRTAKEGVREAVEAYIKKDGIAKAQELIVAALVKEGVPLERLLDHYQIAETKALDVDMIVEMRGNLRAIQNGEEHADNIYPPTDAEAAEKEAKAQVDGKTQIKHDLDDVAASLGDTGRRGNGRKAAPVQQQPATVPTETTAAVTVAPVVQAPPSPPKPPAVPKSVDPSQEKLAALRTLLSVAQSIEQLDNNWQAYFVNNHLTDPEMVAAEAIYGERATKIQAGGNPSGTVAVDQNRQATQQVNGSGPPSDAAKEFAKAFANSMTERGVNAIVDRASRQSFGPADLAFIGDEGAKRAEELRRKK